MNKDQSKEGKEPVARLLVGKHQSYSNPNIYQRLSWISEQIKYVKKDEKTYAYWAASHDQVTAIIQPKKTKGFEYLHLDQSDGDGALGPTRRH